MNTQKLYYIDSYVTEFEANIVEVHSYKNGYALILNKTYFYPESGGQPSDIGMINGSYISYVIEDQGKVLHITDNKLEIGSADCRIDWNNRFDNMQQHSGQHIISACFYRLFKGETSSFHIGKESATIEIDLNSFDSDAAKEIEIMANSFVYKALPLTADIVDKERLMVLPLRKQPQVEKNIRIITIQDCDCTPCGGTHVKNTGEIGLIKLKKWEKLKNSCKFEFVCGQRALNDYIYKNQLVSKLGTYLSAPDYEVENAFLRLTEDYKNLQRHISQLRVELVNYEVQKLLQEATQIKNLKVISKVWDAKDFNDVKLIAQAIVSNLSHIALLATGEHKLQLIFACSQDVDVNMNNLLKAVLPILNGKGGGSARAAQGGGYGDIAAAFDAAIEALEA